MIVAAGSRVNGIRTVLRPLPSSKPTGTPAVAMSTRRRSGHPYLVNHLPLRQQRGGAEWPGHARPPSGRSSSTDLVFRSLPYRSFGAPVCRQRLRRPRQAIRPQLTVRIVRSSRPGSGMLGSAAVLAGSAAGLTRFPRTAADAVETPETDRIVRNPLARAFPRPARSRRERSPQDQVRGLMLSHAAAWEEREASGKGEAEADPGPVASPSERRNIEMEDTDKMRDPA